MMTTRTWSLCSDLDGVGTAMITSRVMSAPSSAHPRRVANPSRSPRQADFADPLTRGLRSASRLSHIAVGQLVAQGCLRTANGLPHTEDRTRRPTHAKRSPDRLSPGRVRLDYNEHISNGLDD